MKLMLKLALVLVLALSLSLLYAAASGDAKKGKELFTKSCVQCHGEKGEGKAAIEKLFGVTVTGVNTMIAKGKSKRWKGKPYTRSDVKKAVVTLDQAPAAREKIGAAA